jgi:DinB superfamily
VSDAAALIEDVVAARQRLIEFVDRCPPRLWTSSPLADGDPRPVAVIVDHVADAYEYLGSFVSTLARGETVEVSPDIVDELNARHAAATRAPTPEDAVAHLVRSGDRFVALVRSLPPEQVAHAGGGVTVARFAQIAALHADSHRTELEVALGFEPPAST